MYNLVSEYVDFYKSNGRQPSSVAQCAEKLTRILRTLEENFGVEVLDTKIEGLNKAILIDYYVSLHKSGLAMSTRNNYVSFLNPFLLWASNKEYLDEKKRLWTALKTNKLPLADQTHELEGKSKHLPLEQVIELLENPPGRNKIRDQAIIALFTGSGLRVSELCSLTIGSFKSKEHEEGYVYVKRKGGAMCLAEVADFVYDYLDKYLETRDDKEDLAAPLFVTTHGRPCNRHQIYKVLSYKQCKMGLATGPHVLRHTVVSTLGNNENPAIARDVANHKSIVVTSGYIHTKPEERRAALNNTPWAKRLRGKEK